MQRFVMALVVVLAFFSTPLSAPQAAAQFPPAPGTGPGLAETIEAIDSAAVTTRILYVTAHPDDESAAILTYLARGLHADVALLALTRGEGGQNALGPEQAPQLGLIRTQELLAATRGYGVKLYFTRAKDFGFSKTPEETEKIWGDQVLEDMVRVIRTFRPNVVINNLIGGHGHHVAAGRLTPKAVQLAADATAYSQIVSDVDGVLLQAWGVNNEAVKVLDVDRGARKPNGYVLPVDDVSPLYGKSYRQIGIDAFANHHTQGVTGFLNSPFLAQPYALVSESGDAVTAKMLATPLQESSPDKKAGGTAFLTQISKNLQSARDAALVLDWKTAAKDLVTARFLLIPAVPEKPSLAEPKVSDPENFNLWDLEDRIDRAVALTAGLTISADSDRSELVIGEAVSIRTKTRCRPEVSCEIGSDRLRGPFESESGVLHETKRESEPGGLTVITASVGIPSPRDPAAVILPELPSVASIEQYVKIFGYSFRFNQPVTHIAATTTHAERVPLRIVPAYTLAVEPAQAIEVLPKEQKPFDVLLRVHSYATQPGKVSVGVEVPPGWTSSAPVAMEFTGSGDQYTRLAVSPPGKLDEGNYTIAAYAQRSNSAGGKERFTTSLEPMVSMPILLWSSPAECVVHAFDVTVPPNLHVGYISAESEPVPEALARLGIHVDALDAAAVNFGDLSKFDAIVVGVRAYELRPELAGANQRLLNYASQGGTLLVQYQRDFAWDKFQYAPYLAKIDGAGGPLPRITDETAEVKFLKPDDPLLNTPNKITQKDFAGWVQERGLYFWSQFDEKYTPLLAMHDPGEPDLNGGLVYARYGKGMYIYTGLAFFRQLPEGVPGAYRLFVNLLSATRQAPAQK